MPPRDEQVLEEARRLHALFAAQPAQLVQFLSGQIATVKSYAQLLVGLCGLTVTVTGFSGAHMIRAGSLSAGLMVAGIALVLVGLVLCLRTITGLRWVSQELRDDLVETATVVLHRRNRKQRTLEIAAVFVAVGLMSYLGAVSVAALVSGNLDP
ncbi:MAG: hypothetical protein R3B48_01500 [Kofleriaceae bacterium]